MIDKIFFLDKLPSHITTIVDVGCADGAVLKTIKFLFPELHCVGYDSGEVLRQIEDPMGVEFIPGMYFDVDVEDSPHSCILLSSVIHEIYSYGPAEVKAFWSWLWASGWGCIAIRDMCVSSTASRPADPLTVARVRQIIDPLQIAQHEKQWGSLEENWSLVHFLLKYRYKENWDREVRENYLPLSKENLLSLIPKEYNVTFIEHFVLPFLRKQVELDIGIVLQEQTHLKLILERG